MTLNPVGIAIGLLIAAFVGFLHYLDERTEAKRRREEHG